MKQSIIKLVLFVTTFLIAVLVISNVMNKGNTDMTAEISPPSLPLMYMKVEGEKVNPLHGYTSEMEISYIRDTITPVGENRKLSLEVLKYQVDIATITFEVRNLTGERLVESTVVTEYQETPEKINFDITIKDLIEPETEYNLVLLIEDIDGRVIRYYTRIIQAIEYNSADRIDFVKDFHQKTFDKEAAKSLVNYLESNAEGDNSSFHKVDIHSNFKMITWGDLNPTKLTEPEILIRELGSQTASIYLQYFVETKEGKDRATYAVEEYYRVRYVSNTMYLLDYERKMDQLFDFTEDNLAKNKIVLGITSDDLEMKESDGGSNLAFVYQDQLYCYNIAEHRFARLFSFYDAENRDLRTTYKGSEIKILSVDEAGNVRFMVYGYLSRGNHEGKNGIMVYYYNNAVNTIEEDIFIPYYKSHDVLIYEMEQLSFVSKNNIFYFLIDNTVYAVDLLNKTIEIIVTGLIEGSFEISEDNERIAWQVGTEIYDCKEMVLMNLNTKKQSKIQAVGENRLEPLGFMEGDLIYGVARKSDMVADSSGRIIFPMYEVKIQNENGEVWKTYNQVGIYVEECVIEENQITLERLVKSEDGLTYQTTTADQIMNNEVIEVGVNRIETAITERYQKVVQIVLKDIINFRSIKFLTPREVLYESSREIALTKQDTVAEKYYVYGKAGVRGVFTNPRNAINLAYAESSVVTNSEGAHVWTRGNRNLRNQIMDIKEEAVTEEKNSVVVCIDAIFKYEGISKNAEYYLEHGDSVLKILEENLENATILDLKGCSLDAILYYINRDIPVLALTEAEEALLIIGFNEFNIVLLDPKTGTIYKKPTSESETFFKQYGNSFITYIPKVN